MSRFLSLVLLSVLVCSAPGQVAFKATRVLDRADQLTRAGPPRQIAALPPLLSEAEANAVDKLRRTGSPHFLAKRPTEAGPDAPGLVRHGFGTDAGFPLWVVEDDLLKLPDPAFMSAYTYLRLLQCHARQFGKQPGILGRGAVAVAASSYTYRTRWAWSLTAKEEAAAWYCLSALNGGSVGLAPDARSVQKALARFHPSLDNGKAAADLLEVVPVVLEATGRKDKPIDEKKVQVFRLDRFLASGVSDVEAEDGQVPPAIREAAERWASAVEKDRKAYGQLAYLYRLVRRLRSLAGRDAVLVARANKGLATAEKVDVPATTAKLAAQCEAWVGWFDDEVCKRGNGTAVMPSATGVSWCPHALAELWTLVMEHSVVYAEQVRVPYAEEGNKMTADDLAKRMRKAFDDDPILKCLGKAYGVPSVEVIDEPTAISGRVTVLRWEIAPPAGTPKGEVVLLFETAFSQGGSGLPVPPCLADDQSLPVRRPSVASPPVVRPLGDVKGGDLVESLIDLRAKEPPTKRVRIHPVGSRKSLQMPGAVVATMGDKGQLCGSISQEIWARQGAGNWKWVALGVLQTGDIAWSHQHGECTVTAVRFVPASGSFSQLTLANSNNTHVNSFVVKTLDQPIEFRARHGIEVSALVPLSGGGEVPIGEIVVDVPRRKFPRVDGFTTDTSLVRRRKGDLLINLSDDQAPVFYRIVYHLDGTERSLATAPDHGFLVSRGKRNLIVEASNLAPGDLLVRDETGATAAVAAIGIEMRLPGEGAFRIRHPRLLRSEWMNCNGVIVHTDRDKNTPPGLIDSTRVSLAKSAGKTGWLVAPAVKVVSLMEEKKPVLSFNPVAAFQASRYDPFLGRPVERVAQEFTAKVVRLVTIRNQTLTCGLGTMLWKKTALGEDRARIETVEAIKLRKGDLILALKKTEGGRPETEWVSLVSRVIIDSMEKVPELGFYELYLPSLEESRAKGVATFLEGYDNIFANELCVALSAGEYEEKVKAVPSPIAGPGGPGMTPNPKVRGVTPGKTKEKARESKSPFQEKALAGAVIDPVATPLARFDQAEVDMLQRRLEVLEREMQALLKKTVPLEEEGPRWERFAGACLPDGPFRKRSAALSRDSLRVSFQIYTDYRSLLIRTGHPQALEAIGRIAMPFGFMLRDAGGPEVARLLLEDLLTIQMLLALRPGSGKAVWKNEDFLVRDSVRYCLEFARLDLPVPKEARSSAEPYWGVTWSCEGWESLLLGRVEDKEIHPDVRNPKTSSRDGVKLYNLLLQMDARSGQSRPIKSFLSEGFKPGTEFSESAEVARRLQPRKP